LGIILFTCRSEKLRFFDGPPTLLGFSHYVVVQYRWLNAIGQKIFPALMLQ
jgi:hypothetical protein